MKKLLIATLFFTTTSALAHPGGHRLSCHSVTGAKQKISFELHRSNGTGYFAPEVSISVDGTEYAIETNDEMNSYGETFHNSPLGVITVTVNNYPNANAKNQGIFSVVAIPSSVKAYDYQGKRVSWNLKQEKEDDSCYDSNGKALFRAIFHGYLRANENSIPTETQEMDCELSYNSGMAC